MADDQEKTGSEHDGSNASPEKSEKEPTGSMKDYVRIFKFADKYDWTLNIVALVSAVASGASLPLMTLIFGGFTNKFNDFSTGGVPPASFKSDVDTFVLWFIYLFIGKFAVTYIATVAITISATRTTRNLRRAFLESTLRQEVWHFDKQNNGATATQVTTNGNKIQSGIAEKLVFTIQALAMFFSSFIVALSAQWKLALITMSIIPAIFIVTGVCIGIDAANEAQIIRIYSRAAVLA